MNSKFTERVGSTFFDEVVVDPMGSRRSVALKHLSRISLRETLSLWFKNG